MAEDGVSSANLFSGARRVQSYREGDPGEEPRPEAGAVMVQQRSNLDYVTNATSARSHGGSHLRNEARLAAAAALTTPRTRVTLAPPPGPAPARWGWRGRLYRGTGGLLRLAPDPAELGHREAIATIRQAAWPRAVNVIVTNPKGGSGKTPTALLLAGILGHIRGGYVAAWEAAESAGSLNRRAEGDPQRGLAELLGGVGEIRSAVNLGGYTAPQTSYADVIGSVGRRPVLTAADVLATRRVLDIYYRITVTDTGTVPGHEAYLAALLTADAAVLPCLVSIDALAGVEEALTVMREVGGHVTGPGGLLSRAVVVLGHDGGPEDAHIAGTVRARLDRLGVAAVMEVPFDPAIRLGGELTLASLSERSTRAWTAAAAAVITALQSAPTEIDLVHQLQAATTATTSQPG
jgi:MinD-like ATPase involved in chromosome partitioning or flagellar assembly